MGNPKGLAKNDVRHVEFKMEHPRMSVFYNYDVSFDYLFDYPVLLDNNRVENRDVTLAFVRANYGSDSHANFTGMAILNPNEDFSRPEGRKWALLKVLDQQFRFSQDEKDRFMLEFYKAENGVV